MKEVTIRVFNVIGGSLCSDTDDGEKVYKLVNKALQEKKKVVLSFKNIDLVTTAFLNVAVGQLYRDYEEAFIENHLKTTELDEIDTERLKDVKDTAILFYKDPERLQRSIDEVLEDDSWVRDME